MIESLLFAALAYNLWRCSGARLGLPNEKPQAEKLRTKDSSMGMPGASKYPTLKELKRDREHARSTRPTSRCGCCGSSYDAKRRVPSRPGGAES